MLCFSQSLAAKMSAVCYQALLHDVMTTFDEGAVLVELGVLHVMVHVTCCNLQPYVPLVMLQEEMKRRSTAAEQLMQEVHTTYK